MVTRGSEPSLAEALDSRIDAERRRGRPPTLTDEQALELVKEYLQQPVSLRDIARRRGLTVGVCKRAVARVRKMLGDSGVSKFLEETPK